MARWRLRVRALEGSESSVLPRILQAMTKAQMSENGKGMESRSQGTRLRGVYPRREQERLLLPRPPRGRMVETGGARRVICLGRRRSGGGVTCQSSGTGQDGRWIDAVACAPTACSAAWHRSSERFCPRLKMGAWRRAHLQRLRANGCGLVGAAGPSGASGSVGLGFVWTARSKMDDQD